MCFARQTMDEHPLHLLFTGSGSFWPAAWVLSLLVWLLGRTYRQVVTSHDGVPPSYTLDQRSWMRRWITPFEPSVPGDPDWYVGKGRCALSFLRFGGHR